MLQKWKNILTNWINCYFIESDEKEPFITLDTILSIISHLRENLSLDESKSSILEAHTVEEFLKEKYPEFHFSDGTVEANNDEELYMVASLLLFFVCVNSKRVDIKNAMCSKLSMEDQEVILRFSKCLMECSPITFKDVQTAVTEACSPVTMVADAGSSRSSVAETPPALRSLHGEVRRLQAALDAERFDRNYLQEELARTNLRVEKLSKDKEQYKLDIVNLKAKISMCCGQESEAKAGDKAAEGTAKLMKELQQTEERLVETQGQLDEALYERDTYKTKVNELKQERDKWLSLSQQEAARVIQLSEELSVERRHVQSLKELVEELRQHQQLNRLDTSQLECDDPDASVHSLPHNSSICSEACANVVEVQLSEERAKIVLLKQQIQSLQEQLNEFTQKSESEILSLNKIISEKDNNILNLKHRINEEIEAKNKLVIQYSDENSRLNNELNELEQKLKDNNSQYRLVIETKMQEIQTLQEEKLSLLQSLNDETTKLEDIIKSLNSEIAEEKDSKLKMKEDYDNHIMKLNEKVLNRNNELVELQNNVIKQSEQIESLHLELRKEKQARDEIIEKYHCELQLVNSKRMEAEHISQQKNEEIESLMDRLNNNYTYTEELNRELNLLKDTMSQLTAKCNDLEETRDYLNQEIGSRDTKLDEQCKDIENFKNILSEERNSFKKQSDDYESNITTLTKTLEETREEMSHQKDSYTAVLEIRARDIQTLQQENQSLIDELNDVKHQLDLKVHSLQEKLTDNENLTEKLKNSYECQIENLNVMVTKLTAYMKDKTIELDSLRKDKEQLQEVVDSNNNVIKTLEEEIKAHKNNQEKLISEFESERLVLKNMVTVTESVMEDQRSSLNEVISNHVKDINILKEELNDLQHRFATEKEVAETKIQEKEEMLKSVINELSEEKNIRVKLETDVENQKQHFTSEINKLQENLSIQESRKELLESQNKELTAVLQKCSDDFAVLKKEKYLLGSEVKIFKDEMESVTCKLTNLELRSKDLEHDSQRSRKVIAQMREHNKSLVSEIKELKTDIELKHKQIEELRMKNDELEGLLQICQNDKEMTEESNKELKIQKDLKETELINKNDNISKKVDEQIIVIKKLESELDDKNKRNQKIEEDLLMLTAKLESITKDNEQLQLENTNNKAKITALISEMSTNVVKLNNRIAELNTENCKLQKSIEDNEIAITYLEDQLKLERHKQEKIMHDFESEKQVLTHKVEVCKSVIEKQKENQNQLLSEHAEVCAALRKENTTLKETVEAERIKSEQEIQDKDTKIAAMSKEIINVRIENENLQKHFLTEKKDLLTEIETLKTETELKSSQIVILESQSQELTVAVQQYKKEIIQMEESNGELKIKKDCQETELLNKLEKTSKELCEQQMTNKELEQRVQEKDELIVEFEHKLTMVTKELEIAVKDTNQLQQKLNAYEVEIEEVNSKMQHETSDMKNVIDMLKEENIKLTNTIEQNKTATALELEQKVQEKNELIAEIEHITNALETAVKDKNHLQQKLNAYEVEIEEVNSKMQQKTSEMNNEIDKLKAENTKLINIIEQSKTATALELEQTVQEKNELIAEMEHITNELETAVKDKNDLQQKLNEYEVEIEVVNSKMQHETSEMKNVIDKLKAENTKLTNTIEENKIAIESLENKVQLFEQEREKYITDFEIERQQLKEMIKTSESAVEEHKENLYQVTSEHHKTEDALKEEINSLKETIKSEKKVAQQKLQEKEITLETKIRKLYELINEKENHHKVLAIEKESLVEEIDNLKKEITLKSTQMETLQYENNRLEEVLQKCKNDLTAIEVNNNELKILIDTQETESNKKLEDISKQYNEQIIINKHLESTLEEKHKLTIEIEEKVRALNNQVEVLTKAYNRLEQEKNEYKLAIDDMKAKIAKEDETVNEVAKLREENLKLMNLGEDYKKVISNLEEAIRREKDSNDFDKLNLTNKCSLLQEYQVKAEKQLEERHKELALLNEELKSKTEDYERVLKEKDSCIKEKDEKITSITQELKEINLAKEKLQKELDARIAIVSELKHKLDNAHSEDVMRALRNEEWVKEIVHRDVYAATGSEKTGSHKHSSPLEKDYREFHQQVDNTTSDLTHSSMESIKTISDLEKIIHDKNRTITTLQSDITYLKSLVADSENKLLDVSKALEVSKENCQQLSSQLKKIVHQKNEEIAELKKQLNKMSITENRASQIIKVSAKYQAIILKRISEIKSNAVLKELTNFGNPSNGDNELRRSLNAGTVTMEDLENFLETTDKHLRRCSEKQIALQKERDRLTEVNRINESEIINLKKFLTELSVGFKTFSSVKELYTQKLSRVVSVQRTVRREILSLDGHINDATMCKLERGYAAVMQDLSECVMNLERWVERCISRTISPEKIKQAFSSEDDRASLASTTYQNASLEVQLEELENSFQKLLEEVVRAQKGEGARDAQSVTVMEVRAEYEDKLNRMKAKMKQLYQEQISVYKEKQREEIGALERELVKTREKLAESSKAYEEHIKALTTELWRVGEKFLSKKDELEWERRKQRSGSLMSLQHVHSSGLVPPRDENMRMSDAHSLRSLPVHNNTNKREGRGLHMSDEEGEVFDNRWLKELSATPSRRDRNSPARLSELRWRNSLCPPHLKSSYPAETQFAPAIDEEDIKYTGAASLGGRNQRKEVGITAYKKPGPPTPSKQAGRLSATDSELRESLRTEPEPQVSRKTSTPSRLRSLFRSNKNDTTEGTPRSRRLSIFRKK